MSIVPGSVYKHYKGNLYKIVALAKHAETLEELVVYQAMDGGAIWVRPLSMFLEVLSDQMQPRFTRVEDN